MDSTANLGLHLPAQNDYADIAVLNENFEKIDTAMAAARSAEEYNPAGTYAVGSYCTHEAKLYRCTTAITTAEAWTAAHWTETTVAGEFAALYTALAGKVNNNHVSLESPNMDDLPDGSVIHVNYNDATPPEYHTPVSDLGLTGGAWYVVSTFKLELGGGYWRGVQIAANPINGLQSVYIRYRHDANWSKWAQFATATSPADSSLPLASGISNIAGYTSTCSKDQFGRVTVNLLINHSDNSVFNTWHEVVATLPVGYRPDVIANAVGIAVSDTTSDSMGVAALSDGTIHIYPFTTTQVRFTGTFEFKAGN